MPINQTFLGELDHEVATTRKMILRIPDDKLDWKPHEKSMTAGTLASHIAEMYSWGDATMRVDELELAPVGGTKWEAFNGKSAGEIAAKLDANFASVKEAVR